MPTDRMEPHKQGPESLKAFLVVNMGYFEEIVGKNGTSVAKGRRVSRGGRDPEGHRDIT